MFESLNEKLSGALNKLSSKGRLTEKDVDKTLREIRLAFLEADVNYKVTRNFIARIRERSLGEDVLSSLSPGQQVVKITNEELSAILGGGVKRLIPSAKSPSVMLMVGLNGSGKTTTSAKLARYLKSTDSVPVLVAADLQRPAAIQQLQTLGIQAEVEVYSADPSTPVEKVVMDGLRHAEIHGAAWLIVDTAGRLQIDQTLMGELQRMKEIISPAETILVVDAMTGQESVNVANEFNDRIGITGMVLSKLDGDARGGAALSITSVTGVPIKFVGTGERIDMLEEFHPDRLASRILGMGDVVTLIEKAERAFDKDQAASLEKKFLDATFDLDDFLDQMKQIKGMGPLSQILDLMPGMASLKNRADIQELGDDKFKTMEAIVLSMTRLERSRPELIKGSRRRRIALGSGTTTQDVNMLLNQFQQTRKIMRHMVSGKGLGDIQRLIR